MTTDDETSDPDIYTGPVLAGMRFEYKDSVFIPDGRRGKHGEFLNAQGDGLSEPNLRGMYRPIPAPAPESSAPPSGVPVCKGGRGKCGTRVEDLGAPALWGFELEGLWFCSQECRTEHIKATTTPPSDPATVATGEPVSAHQAPFAHDCDIVPDDDIPTAEEGRETVKRLGIDVLAWAADIRKRVAAVATGGVPMGFRLGDGWSFRKNVDFWCSHNERTCSGVGPFKYYETHRGACAAHAAELGALVPIDTARPGPAHPANGTTCTRCGQVIQSVLPAFPPVATVDGWRHERCPEVPPGPVPVEAGRTGGHTNECATWNPGRARCDCQPVAPPAAPASEPAVTCSVPCLSRTCSRTCELDHGHPPDRDHSHASRSNEAGHTWPASEPAVRPLSVPQEAIDREVAECRAMERKFPVSRPDSTAVVVALADRLDAARAEIGQLHERAEKAEALRNQAIAYLETEMNNHRATAAEVEQLRGKLAEEREDGRAERVMLLERLDQATARVRSMRRLLDEGMERIAELLSLVSDHSDDIERSRAAIEWADKAAAGAGGDGQGALQLDTGTATDASEEPQADAIKAAVAPHVCKCSNGPCPKCGGTGPEGEWFEGSEVECADCGAPLIVATAEPCHGSSTFEAIDEEPDEEDDESGEDAPGAVGK